jgi:hypothetical protein
MPKIQVFECPSCGASLSYEHGSEPTITCQFCGSNVIVPEELREHHDEQPSITEMPVYENIFTPSSDDLLANPPSDELYQLRQLVNQGQKIEAIKHYRKFYGVGLKEAKDAIDALGSSMPAQPVHAQGGINPARRLIGILVVIGFVAFVGAIVMGAPFRMSGSFRQVLEAANADPAVIEALGAPIKASWWPISGELSCSVGTCSANYSIPVHGSRRSAKIVVMSDSKGAAFLKEGTWVLDATVILDAGESFELAPSPVPSPTLSIAALNATEAVVTQATQSAQAILDTESTATNQANTATAQAEAASQATLDAAAAARAQAMIATQATWSSIFVESFTDNHNNWPTGVSQDQFIRATTLITDGKYLLTVNPKQGNCYLNFIPDNSQAVTDFSATVSIKFPESEAGGVYTYGLVYRQVNDDYGFFGIQNDGTFRVLVVYNTGIYQDIEHKSSAIHTQPSQANQIIVRAIGSDFVFSINDQVVWLLTEDMAPGNFGIGVDVINKQGEAQVEFANFEVRAP